MPQKEETKCSPAKQLASKISCKKSSVYTASSDETPLEPPRKDALSGCGFFRDYEVHLLLRDGSRQASELTPGFAVLELLRCSVYRVHKVLRV